MRVDSENSKLEEIIKNKRVLFITTKNIDYIRNTQEIRLIQGKAKSCETIYSRQEKYLFRVLSVLMKVRKKIIDRNDIIFIGFAPQLVLPILAFKFRNKITIIDFFISIYDTVIFDRKIFKENGIMAKLCYEWDQYTLKKANHIITDTKAHTDFFISKFKIDRRLFETIYLEADSKIYYTRPQVKSENLKNKFVVLYFGSILPLQGINIILDTVKLMENDKDVFFQIIGPISSKYTKPIHSNVTYLEWVSQEELATYIANADLCLAGHFDGNIEKAKRTIPGKAYIYEAMGKNMILGDNFANRELFSENNQHTFVKMGDTSDLQKKITERKDEWLIMKNLKN